MYAQEIAEMASTGTDVELSGDIMIDRILGSVYQGLAGKMRISKNGERDNDMELRNFNAKSGEFEVISLICLLLTSDI